MQIIAKLKYRKQEMASGKNYVKNLFLGMKKFEIEETKVSYLLLVLEVFHWDPFPEL